jgi:hypothetical protein
MIVYPDTERGDRTDEVIGHHDIGTAWLRVATGMVVRENKRGCTVSECVSNDPAQWHSYPTGQIIRVLGNSNQLPCIVEVQNAQNLNGTAI